MQTVHLIPAPRQVPAVNFSLCLSLQVNWQLKAAGGAGSGSPRPAAPAMLPPPHPAHPIKQTDGQIAVVWALYQATAGLALSCQSTLRSTQKSWCQPAMRLTLLQSGRSAAWRASCSGRGPLAQVWGRRHVGPGRPVPFKPWVQASSSPEGGGQRASDGAGASGQEKEEPKLPDWVVKQVLALRQLPAETQATPAAAGSLPAPSHPRHWGRPAAQYPTASPVPLASRAQCWLRFPLSHWVHSHSGPIHCACCPCR